MRPYQAREQAIVAFRRNSSHVLDAGGTTEGLRALSAADSVLEGARYPGLAWIDQTVLGGIVVASFCHNALL
jgi:hypothetical protein